MASKSKKENSDSKTMEKTIKKKEDTIVAKNNSKKKEETTIVRNNSKTKEEIAIAKYNSFCFNITTAFGQILFLFVAIIITYFVQWLSRDMTPNSLTLFKSKTSENVNQITHPTYFMYGEHNGSTHLRLVHLVLHGMGIKPRQNFDNKSWDLMWAHYYPFSDPRYDFNKLQPHQKVNHFPGNWHLAQKVLLATTENKYIPKSFMLPSDKEKFLEYAKQNPNKLFVQKNNNHREIYVRGLDEIDYNDNRTFIQEYIDNPLLIDGHRFDFGVYVIITSIDPLRVYIYKGDVMFRYCPEKYYPFDAKNLKKYIISDDYLPTWQMDALAHYYVDFGFGMKATFDAYMNSKEIKTDDIWFQVEDAIRSIIVQKETFLVQSLLQYGHKYNFFEMLRFDLIIDSDLNVYLLEANMSPNLSSIKFPQHETIFKQVLFNFFNLVGVGSTLERESLSPMDPPAETMLSSEKHIVVNPDTCSQEPCTEKESCSHNECLLCLPCLTPDIVVELHEANREHMRKGDTKRIFPVPMTDEQLVGIEFFQNLTPKNYIMTEWFYGKCLLDSNFCS